MNTLFKCGLIGLCFSAVSSVWTASTKFDAEEGYGKRLDAAANTSTAWERYVALNHDWSPGAWCVPGLATSSLQEQWADEAHGALVEALLVHDHRAVAYLYSPEAAWWCLDTLRAQYPSATPGYEPARDLTDRAGSCRCRDMR